MNRTSSFAWLPALFAAALSLACAPEFDPPSKVQSLRVLAVKKDKPYARPGDSVTLKMLWYDGSAQPLDEAPRGIERAWITGCINPPGDVYYSCFGQFAQNPESALFALGDEVTAELPKNMVRPPLRPGQPAYGLSFIFFAVCAGTLTPDPSVTEGIPLTCLDENGSALGADDFVIGYSAIYVFDEIANQNPIVTGFEFQGEEVTPDCIGDDCIDAAAKEVDCIESPNLCVPTCADDGKDSCKKYQVKPIASEESAESDEVSATVYGSEYMEQVWVDYYVSDGRVSPSVKLLNDATRGWNSEYEADFRAPKAPGPVLVWAIVHDNRGGVEFARLTLMVQ